MRWAGPGPGHDGAHGRGVAAACGVRHEPRASPQLLEFDRGRADFARRGRMLRVPVTFPERQHACNLTAAAADALGVDPDEARS